MKIGMMRQKRKRLLNPCNARNRTEPNQTERNHAVAKKLKEQNSINSLPP